MKSKHHILVIDDEKAICVSLRYFFEDDFEVYTTTDPVEGLSLMKNYPIDVVILDLRLGDKYGTDFIDPIIAINPDAKIIMMTAYGTIQSSLEAIKKGAYTYIEKPLNMDELKLIVDRSIEMKTLTNRMYELQEELQQKYSYQEIVGRSKKIEEIFMMIKKVKDIDSTILVQGESGTGKELVAKAVHYSGNRQNQRFIDVNCAAIPEDLLESELFGYEKGAFTGANQDKMGKIVVADKGTLFLDEIGEMPLSLQSKLLRLIQEREVTPLGSTMKINVDVRIIAATNKDLREEVKEGRFREDLFYRLNVIQILIPPLRERKEDIPSLVTHFIKKYSKDMNKEMFGAEPTAMKVLLKYMYPGNIRELSNIIERAVALSEGTKVKVSDLPQEIVEITHNYDKVEEYASADNLVIRFGETIKDVERKLILFTLNKLEGHRKKTAEILGISDRGLREKMHRYKTDKK